MSVLQGKRCYLSGPIEHGTGVNWRELPKQVLVGEFGIDLFDPYSDPKQQWVNSLLQARENKDYETMAKIARAFVRKDLCMVDRSDFIIANLPYPVPTCGTHHEIINSVNAKKPTLLVCEQGKEKIPLWYYGFIQHETMFSSWEDLFTYLRDIEAGKYRGVNNRWDYVYGLV